METYEIKNKHVKAVNVLIRALQEAIDRKAFNNHEIESIVKTIKVLNSP